MNTISFKLNHEESNFIRQYAKTNGLSLSDFIRNAVLDEIENNMELSEQTIKNIEAAKEDIKHNRVYILEEVRKELDL